VKYLFCGGATTQRVWKLDPATMAKVSEGPNYGGTIFALTEDGRYLYCALA
jgi:hypothetical protein